MSLLVLTVLFPQPSWFWIRLRRNIHWEDLLPLFTHDSTSHPVVFDALDGAAIYSATHELKGLLVHLALMCMDGDVCVHPFRVPLMIYVIVWRQFLGASVIPMWIQLVLLLWWLATKLLLISVLVFAP